MQNPFYVTLPGFEVFNFWNNENISDLLSILLGSEAAFKIWRVMSAFNGTRFNGCRKCCTLNLFNDSTSATFFWTVKRFMFCPSNHLILLWECKCFGKGSFSTGVMGEGLVIRRSDGLLRLVSRKTLCFYDSLPVVLVVHWQVRSIFLRRPFVSCVTIHYCDRDKFLNTKYNFFSLKSVYFIQK